MQIKDIQKKLRISISIIFKKLDEMGIEYENNFTEIDDKIAYTIIKEIRRQNSIKVLAICKKYNLPLEEVFEHLTKNKIRFKNKFSIIPLKKIENIFQNLPKKQEEQPNNKPIQKDIDKNSTPEDIPLSLCIVQIADKLQISKVCVKKEMRKLKIDFESILQPLPKQQVDGFIKKFTQNRKRKKVHSV